MEIIGKFIHGSEDSLDVDIVYQLDEEMDFRLCKKYCETLDGNPNLMVVRDGVVSWCYKGSIDETNNGLFETIPLHEQEFENPIKRKVERNLGLKAIRATRGIISHLSRSCFRTDVKASLVGSFETRIELMKTLDLSKIEFDSLYANMSGADIKKLIAFQIGQTLALIDGVELFTKREIGERYCDLRPYLYREDCSVETLNEWLKVFAESVSKIGIEDIGDRVVSYCGHKYSLKNENELE